MLLCSNCGELIAEDTTVCPHCDTPEPLAEAAPPHPAPLIQAEPDRTQVSDPARYAGRGRPTGIGGLLAFGGAGLLVRALVLVAAACFILGAYGLCAILGDGALSGTGSGDYECQALYGDFASSYQRPELDGLGVQSISLTRHTDDLEWNKRVCPAVAETSAGRYNVWIEVTGESETEWEFEFRTEPVE